MAKPYSIYLASKVFELIHESESLSGRINQIIARYAWINRIEEPFVRQQLGEEAIKHLAAGWNAEANRKIHPSLIRQMLSDEMAAGGYESQAESIKQMSEARLVALLEMIESDALDWASVYEN